jgi:putative oxidoreductase
MEFLDNLVMLIARILISAGFLWGAAATLRNWHATAEHMKSKNLPSSLLPASVALQIIGGLSVLLGFEARVGAVLLIVFLIPTTVKMHDFWNVQGPERVIEKALFMKDGAILGGLLLILAMGAGHFAFH